MTLSRRVNEGEFKTEALTPLAVRPVTGQRFGEDSRST